METYELKKDIFLDIMIKKGYVDVIPHPGKGKVIILKDIVTDNKKVKLIYEIGQYNIAAS